ncbi:MAG: YdjY domain-containing protein [Planctomycetota bacterium]
MKLLVALGSFALSGAVLLTQPEPQEGGAPPAAGQEEPAPAAGALQRLLTSLADEGIDLDLERGIASFEAQVLVRDQLLEYLLVGPYGATHESLFVTEVTPSLLNAAMLALGASPGRNATWVEEELPEGAPEDARPDYRIVPPSGDGFYLHAAWREGEETYFFRVEDLVANLDTGRSMERGALVYLGSKMAKMPVPKEQGGTGGEPQDVFVADVEQNLASLIYFSEGNQLLTCVHGDTNRQDIYAANIWNVPERGQIVRIVLARKPLATVPDSLAGELPTVTRAGGK